MDYNRFEYNNKKKVEIVLFGDIHWGSAQCDTNLVKKTILKIKKNKNIKVILMGDLIENSNKFSVGAGVYEQILTPEKQVKEIVELLYTIKEKILFYHRGNHCKRSFRDTGIDPGQLISSALGCKYIKNMALTDILIGKIRYTFFTWHGAGSSQSTAGRIKVLQRQSETFNADLYAQGHNHDLFSTTIPKRDVIDGKFIDVFKYYVLSGSFCRWDGSYAEEFGYPMMKLGCPKIILNNKKKEIKVDLEYV